MASFIDVPGHERFVRNMLAGAHGIDAVLLVVAADESVMPQTREHFHICRLLGIPRGLVVLTKCDVADADSQALAEMEVRELVPGSFLEGAARPPRLGADGRGPGRAARGPPRPGPRGAAAGGRGPPPAARGPRLHPSGLRHGGHGDVMGGALAAGDEVGSCPRAGGRGCAACRSTARRPSGSGRAPAPP